MKTHKATRISIVAEKLIEDGITRILEDAGATGYSVFEGGGKGSHGPHPLHRPAIVNDFAIIKIEAILGSRTAAEAIAEAVTERYFGKYSGIIYLDEVEILRPEKFGTPEQPTSEL